MSFGQVPPPSWEFNTHIVDPGLELNQENITLFNSQQTNPSDPVFAQSYAKNEFVEPNSYPTQFPDCEIIDSLLFDQAEATNFDNVQNMQTSSESSPNVVNSIMSPQTSDTSGMINYENENKVTSLPNARSSSISSLESLKGTKRSKSKRQLSDEQDAALIARDDSELTEEELQLKRKAQNRAAQRAFRERKQTKLKELEAKLLQSEEERQKLLEELNLIKKQNITISTENEILRSSYNSHNDNNESTRHAKAITTFNFPQNQDDFIEHIVKGTDHHVFPETKNKVYDNDGDKLLALGAVWDYIQIKAEEANLDFNSLDINTIMGALRGHERCHGYGPAYPLDLVNKAIQTSLH